MNRKVKFLIIATMAVMLVVTSIAYASATTTRGVSASTIIGRTVGQNSSTSLNETRTSVGASANPSRTITRTRTITNPDGTTRTIRIVVPANRQSTPPRNTRVVPNTQQRSNPRR